MKYILWLLLVTASSFLNAQPTEPIRVIGTGATEKEAVSSAFEKAIESYVGVAILSGREIKNSKITSDRINTYSAGYIDKFKIVHTEKSEKSVTAVVDVWVKTSVLAEYKTAIGSVSTDIDAGSLAAQIQSFTNERKSLDNFVDEILTDYPKKGLKIQQQNVELYMNSNRTPVITVRTHIAWDIKFLESLRELMNLVKDSPEYFDLSCMCHRARSQISVLYKKNQKDFFWDRDVFFLRDASLSHRISASLDIQPKILASVLDQNRRVIHKQCFWTTEQFTRKEKFKDNLIINGSVYEKTRVEIPIVPNSELHRNINRINSVELEMAKSC